MPHSSNNDSSLGTGLEGVHQPSSASRSLQVAVFHHDFPLVVCKAPQSSRGESEDWVSKNAAKLTLLTDT